MCDEKSPCSSNGASCGSENDFLPTDKKIICCDCSEIDYFDHAGNPDDALCRHCGHMMCSDCKPE
ncbi:uncharacterized protein GGS22DRAFT_159346 [Annulohypoxylon maeteangense]|uniref:uncharacterized protein n=1 Tax=Annulohypoxylon maeteangense TaxID=1927788 RepID=UPI0020084060|nr:uncharacterized protein GGS22DRAFT_159346 [Annulohypoxylon maeteangense]KAI0885931.1 hypothetical protein GGS22DRAFT_159346 [Annulohypoxylon maeteangense]